VKFFSVLHDREKLTKGEERGKEHRKAIRRDERRGERKN